MTTINSAYINALLADASYVDGLVRAIGRRYPEALTCRGSFRSPRPMRFVISTEGRSLGLHENPLKCLQISPRYASRNDRKKLVNVQ